MNRLAHYTTLFAGVWLCCIALTPAAHANLLTNPGFETNGGAGSITSALTGWSASGGGMYLDKSNFHSGSYDIGFTATSFSSSPGVLSQTVSTVAGQSYSLSFWLLDQNFAPGADAFNVMFGGFSDSVAGSSVSPFYTHVMLAIPGIDLTSSSTTLSFQGLLDPFAGTSALYLDDVSLTATAVPEPPSGTLFAAALGLFAMLGVRRSYHRR